MRKNTSLIFVTRNTLDVMR